MQAPVLAERWSPARRIVFRVLFSYFLLYVVTSDHVALLIPYSEVLLRHYIELWYPVVVWVGKDVLHLSQDIYLLESDLREGDEEAAKEAARKAK